MTTHKALHPRDIIGELYMSRKEGLRGVDNSDDSVDTLIRRLEKNIERLITAT